jgi:hypothetical protein
MSNSPGKGAGRRHKRRDGRPTGPSGGKGHAVAARLEPAQLAALRALGRLSHGQASSMISKGLELSLPRAAKALRREDPELFEFVARHARKELEKELEGMRGRANFNIEDEHAARQRLESFLSGAAADDQDPDPQDLHRPASTAGQPDPGEKRHRGAVEEGTVSDSGMHFRRVRFTPEIAAEWLTRIHPRQRDQYDGPVDAYAADMAGGRWFEDSPEVIAVDVNGYVMNGQHRLAAMVASGASLTLWVAFNVPEKAYAVLDMGLKRKPKDTARALGEDFNANELAVARATYIHAGHMPYSESLTQLEVVQVAKTLRGEIREIMQALGTARMSAPIVGAMVNAYHRSSELDRKRILRFCVVMGDSTPLTPEESAATRFLAFLDKCQWAKAHGGAQRTMLFRVTQRALKAFLDGEVLTKLYVPSSSMFRPFTKSELGL